MGAYSPNMLLHWPEQFRQFIYFDMSPNINSSYTMLADPAPRTLWGVLQNSRSDIESSNGNLVSVNHESLWTDNKLDAGKFIQFTESQTIIYRIVVGNDWPNEGGFYNYTIERLVGDNGAIDSTDYTSAIGGTFL